MIYFDITDLFNYLRNNRNVTGIQRVQMKILHALAGQAPDQIKCLVIDAKAPPETKFRTYDARDIFSVEEDAVSLIRGLLKQHHPTRLLDPASVRAALQPHSHRKLYRGLKKIELYASKLLAPNRLARLGYNEDRSDIGRHVQHDIFAGPLRGDLYVLLGHNWSTPEIEVLASSFRRAGGQAIQVIHDVIPVKEPSFFPEKAARDFQRYLDRCQQTFNSFIAVSENTRRDLLSYFGEKQDSDSVKVLRLAHAFGECPRNIPCAHPSSETLAALLNRPFVVSVGTIEPRKNHVTLLKVWCALHRQLGAATPTLVIAGKLGWKTEAFSAQLAIAHQQQVPVIHFTSADDQDLHFLYANCRFSIYPSLYEGWGLPVGESLWLGRPCLASNTSSIPEVCTEGVEYFNPFDELNILSQVHRWCVDDTLIADLTYRVNAQALRDWKQVAFDLLQLIQTTPLDGHRTSAGRA